MNIELVTPSLSNCLFKIYESEEAKTEKICDWHIHPELEMFLLLSGGKSFYIDNSEIQLNLGDIILINSRIPHKTKTSIGSLGILLQFNVETNTNSNNDYAYLEDILEINKTSYKVFKAESSINKELAECIKKINSEYSTKQKSYDYYIKSYVYEIIAILYRNDFLTYSPDLLPKLSNLIPALEYIEKNYKEHITLYQISDTLNFDKSYFCRIFKKTLGISFVEYLNLVRIHKAKELIKNTSKNITQISFEVGFSSVSYFIKTFKKYNLCTPSKYKKILQ